VLEADEGCPTADRTPVTSVDTGDPCGIHREMAARAALVLESNTCTCQLQLSFGRQHMKESRDER
jgi:hypothetical protein